MRPSSAILAELERLRDEPVPADELARAKAYLSGGLELRMDDSRHVASWLGGQEALHDRVLTPRGGARPRSTRSARPTCSGSRPSCSATTLLRMAVVAPPRHGAAARPSPAPRRLSR